MRLPGSKFRLGNGKPYEDGEEHERFTCNAFDQVTGNCLNYENRPQLCRQHGVTTHCDHWGHGCELVPPPPSLDLRAEVEANIARLRQLKAPEVIGG